MQTRVGLQVRGLEVEPDDVSSRLELTPNASHRRGDVVGGDVRTDGWCYFTSQMPRDASFDQHAEWMLRRLEPHAAMLSSWSQRGWRIQLEFITITTANNGGPTVRPELLRRIAALGLATCWRTVCALPR